MREKPYAQSCVENSQPILEILKQYLPACQSVLEIGSGTGQHAVYFAQQFPNVIWHTSDQMQYHEGIQLWIADAPVDNVVAPITLNVNQANWPEQRFDVVFAANTLHIMSWQSVQVFFAKVVDVLDAGGLFIVYGPFNYAGKYTSDSNRQFDQWLVQQHPQSAIRNFEDLVQLAEKATLNLICDHEMPANNRLLVWKNE